MRSLASSLRHGLRSLARAPGFAAAVIATLVLGIDPLAPAPILAIVAILTAVAAIACAIPARRAAGLDPARILREE